VWRWLPELNKGFITDGDGEKVVVFDMKSLKTGEIKTYPDTDSLTYDPASKLIFTFNWRQQEFGGHRSGEGRHDQDHRLGGSRRTASRGGKGTIYDNNEETNDW